MSGAYDGTERRSGERRSGFNLAELSDTMKAVLTVTAASAALLVALGARYEFVGSRVEALEHRDSVKTRELQEIKSEIRDVKIMSCLSVQDVNVRNTARLGCATLLRDAGIEVTR